MKKLFVTLLVVATLFLSSNLKAEIKVNSNEGEAQLLDIDENGVEDYFINSGEARYYDVDKRINLLNRQMHRVGSTYFKERLSVKYDFEIELEINMFRTANQGDGLALGFTESEIGTIGVSGQGFGFVGTKNSVAFIIDTHQFSGEPPIPNVSLRYTKESGNFFDENGKSLGLSTGTWATRINANDFANKRTSITIKYNAANKTITYNFLNKNYVGKMNNIGQTKGLAFLISSSSGTSTDIVDIYIKRVKANLVTETPISITYSENSNGSFTFTVRKQNNGLFPSGTELYVPGRNTPYILGANGTVTVPRNQMPEFDSTGGAYVKESDKGNSGTINLSVFGYRTDTPVLTGSTVLGGSHTIRFRKANGTLYNANADVVIQNLNKKYSLNSSGNIVIPRNEFPMYDLSTNISIQGPNKERSYNVPYLIPGYKTIYADRVEQNQSYYGDVVFTPYKANGVIYAQGTIINIPGYGGNYTIGANGTITIPFNNLPENSTTIKYTIKENDKEVSEERELIIKSQADSERIKIKKRIVDRADLLKSLINSQNDIEDPRKKIMNDEVNAILDRLIKKLEQTRNITSGEEVYNEAVIEFDNYEKSVLLENHKNKQSKEIEKYGNTLISKLPDLEYLDPDRLLEDKNDFEEKIKDIKDIIANESLLSNVDNAYKKGIDDLDLMFLKLYKENSVYDLVNKANNIKSQIDNLALEQDQKTSLKETASTIVERVTGDINKAQTQQTVDSILNDAKRDLDRLLNQAGIIEIEEGKTSYSTDLREKADDTKTSISKYINLTEDQMQDFYDSIESIYDDGIKAINVSESLEDVQSNYQSSVIDMTTKLNEARLQNVRNMAYESLKLNYDTYVKQNLI